MDVAAIATIATGAIAVAGTAASGFQLIRRRLKVRAARDREVAHLVDQIIGLAGMRAHRQAELEDRQAELEDRQAELEGRQAALERDVVYPAEEIVKLKRELADIHAERWPRTRRRRA